ncbi:hypothetical protein C8N41_103349 [Winogradskyella sediminis]|nr:hypothetical protein C8N41_103349 [Winogradskyella sediminis]
MIVNIILILSCLVAINFLLLIFSCNKTTKKVSNKVAQPVKANIKPAQTIKSKKSPTLVSNQLQSSRQLAPTGS